MAVTIPDAPRDMLSHAPNAITTTPVTLERNRKYYVPDHTGLITLNLPGTADLIIGDYVEVVCCSEDKVAIIPADTQSIESPWGGNTTTSWTSTQNLAVTRLLFIGTYGGTPVWMTMGGIGNWAFG